MEWMKDSASLNHTYSIGAGGIIAAVMFVHPKAGPICRFPSEISRKHICPFRPRILRYRLVEPARLRVICSAVFSLVKRTLDEHYQPDQRKICICTYM